MKWMVCAALLLPSLQGCFPDPPACTTSRPCLDEEVAVGEVETGDAADADAEDADLVDDIADGRDSVPNETETIETEVVDAEVETAIDIEVETIDVDEVEVEIEATPECDEARPCTPANACEKARCESGRCVFEAVVCAPLDQCHKAGSCEPATGQCTNPVQTNGTPCDDGVRCTASDACAAGTCGGTTSPNDANRGDFNRGVTGSHGARAAGVASNATDVYLAVAFPLEPAVDSTASLYFGEDATQTQVAVSLPEGVTYGLAIGRYSITGQIISARIAATSDEPITNTELTWLSSGALYISGFFEGGIRLFSILGQQIDVAATTQPRGTFGYNYHDSRPDPIVLEQELPIDVPPRILSHPNECLVIANLAQGRSVMVLDGAGETLDVMSNTGSTTTEAWITWMPQCLPLTVDARRISGVDGGPATAWYGDFTDSGRLVVSVTAEGGVMFGDGESDSPVQTFAGTRSVILGLEANGVAFASRIEDSLQINPFAYAVATSGEAAYVATQLVGQAQLITDGTSAPLIGNPASPTQPAQRMVVFRLDDAGKIVWMHAHEEDKEPIFFHMAAGPSDVAVVTPWGGPYPFNGQTVDVSGTNLVVSTWDADGGRWATPIMSPIEAEDGGINEDRGLTPPFIARVWQTAGLFVAGTLDGRGRLGVARVADLGLPEETSAFLIRINSEDGIGCPAP